MKRNGVKHAAAAVLFAVLGVLSQTATATPALGDDQLARFVDDSPGDGTDPFGARQGSAQSLGFGAPRVGSGWVAPAHSPWLSPATRIVAIDRDQGRSRYRAQMRAARAELRAAQSEANAQWRTALLAERAVVASAVSGNNPLVRRSQVEDGAHSLFARLSCERAMAQAQYRYLDRVAHARIDCAAEMGASHSLLATLARREQARASMGDYLINVQAAQHDFRIATASAHCQLRASLAAAGAPSARAMAKQAFRAEMVEPSGVFRIQIAQAHLAVHGDQRFRWSHAQLLI